MQENGRFDLDHFVGKYKDSIEGHAAVIGGAFVIMQQRFDQVDARLDRIERVLERAYPDEYAAVNGG
ncbi:MAG: hypothetical protein F4X26_09410 [Chloroflexi bacterium]|nr:hypothetical protein [Chloroflexota bacterium]